MGLCLTENPYPSLFFFRRFFTGKSTAVYLPSCNKNIKATCWDVVCFPCLHQLAHSSHHFQSCEAERLLSTCYWDGFKVAWLLTWMQVEFSIFQNGMIAIWMNYTSILVASDLETCGMYLFPLKSFANPRLFGMVPH